MDLDVKLITRQIQARESGYWDVDISLSHQCLLLKKKEEEKKQEKKEKKKNKIEEKKEN
ncbi:hypothetical protein N9Y97_09070 [Pseudomonadales bacterium]|nr:hypothetical protein [Pseudomonadales bacterium]